MTTKKTSLIIALTLLAGIVSADSFGNLFKILNPIGDCKVKRPGETEYSPVIKGKAYPLGSTVTCGLVSSATLQFSDVDAVHLFADTIITPNANKARKGGIALDFQTGSLTTRFNPSCTNDEYIINTSIGTCLSMTGNNKISFVRLLDESTIEMRAEKGSCLRFIGPQFIVPKLQNGCGVAVMTKNDNSFTRITDLLGDFTALLNGTNDINPNVGDEGSDYIRAVKLSTGFVIKIWRENAPVGGRVIISALAMSTNGEIFTHYSQAVGRENIVSISNLNNKPAVKPADGDTESDGENEGIEEAFSSTDDADEATAEESAEAPAADNNDDFLLGF